MLKYLLLIFLIIFTYNQSSVFAQYIVQTDEVYTYEKLEEDIKQIEGKYADLIDVKSLGTTYYDRHIWAVKMGKGDVNVLIHGAHHGREWLTTTLVMKMIETYGKAYHKKNNIEQYSPEILDKVSIWFVPMVNPDGVTLQQKGLKAFPKEDHEKLLTMNEGSEDFTRWKANGRGIDLNRQYPAGWKELEGSTDHPSYKLYKGKTPIEAKEVKVLTDLTKKIDPKIAIAYHSSGRMIFGKFERKYKKIANKLAELTGYELSKPQDTAVGGGYTDWFIKEFNRPGYTLEISFYVKETNPPLFVFDEVWRRNRAVGLMVAEEGYHRSSIFKRFVDWLKQLN